MCGSLLDIKIALLHCSTGNQLCESFNFLFCVSFIPKGTTGQLFFFFCKDSWECPLAEGGLLCSDHLVVLFCYAANQLMRQLAQ